MAFPHLNLSSVVSRPSQSDRVAYHKNGSTYNHSILSGRSDGCRIKPHRICRTLATSDRKISGKPRRKRRLGRLGVEFLWNSLAEDHQSPSLTLLSMTARLINPSYKISQAASGWLQIAKLNTAQKCAKRYSWQRIEQLGHGLTQDHHY